MKTIPLTALMTMVVMSGCSTRATVDALGGAGGAGIGYSISNGDPLITAAGAAGGALTADLLQNAVEKGKRNVAQEAYELGASDTIKTTYQIIQDTQKSKNNQEMLTTKLYKIPAPNPNDGINRTQHTITIPILQ